MRKLALMALTKSDKYLYDALESSKDRALPSHTELV
jgi:hypothetical protein